MTALAFYLNCLLTGGLGYLYRLHPPAFLADYASFLVFTEIDAFVGYKGAGPAVIDVVSDQTAMIFATLSTVHPMLQAGKLVLIAVTTLKRTRAMPDVPTVAESGVPGFSMRSWNGLLGPRGMPDSVIRKLHAEVQAALNSADFTQRLLAVGFEPDPTTPEAFAHFIKEELALHARIVKTAGLKVE